MRRSALNKVRVVGATHRRMFLLLPLIHDMDRGERRILLKGLRDAQNAAGLTRDNQKMLQLELIDVLSADPFDPRD